MIAALDEVHELWTGDAGHVHVWGGRETVRVRAAADRGPSADHADLPVAGGCDGTSYGRPDDLDDGHRIPLAGIVEAGGRRGVARDHEHLDALVDQPVEAPEREPADVGNRPRPVRQMSRVPEVAQLLVRQLIEDRTGHRQAADSRVEDADGRVAHAAEPTLCGITTRDTTGTAVWNVTGIMPANVRNVRSVGGRLRAGFPAAKAG